MNKRLILFMTSFALAATPMSAFASEYTGPKATIEAVEGRAALQATTGEYTGWLQYDSRWGSMLMGGSDTMAESGCLVTAIAMLMVHSGSADENGVNPGKLCTYLNNNNGFTSSSELIWAKVNGAVNGFKLANWKITLSGSRYDKAAQIKRYLDQGYYVVANVGHGAHWVAINYADSNGNVYMFDPAYPYTSLFDSYRADGVVSIATFTSTGNGNGNIVTGEVDITDYDATGKVNVGASYLNVRSGAGTDKSYLKDAHGNQVTLSDGAEVIITGKGKDASGATWYRVSINGLTGYVYGAYVDIVSSGDTVTGEGKKAKVTGNYVNIRSGAGTAYSSVGGAPQNAEITVYETKADSSGNTWYKVKYGNVIGYMIADYIQLEEQKVDETLYTETKSGKVNTALLRVRKGPGTSHSEITTIPLNTAVTLLGEAKDGSGTKWYKIKYSGGEGYVMAEYISIVNGSLITGGSYQQKTGKLNTTSVNVRSGAGTSNSIVGNVSTPTAVTIIGEDKDSSGNVWYKVNYSGGSGYIRSDFITLDGSSNADDSNSGSYTEKSGTVNASGVRVRSGAGTSNNIVGTLYTGTVVTIMGEAKDGSGATWYKIKYSGGEGYMHSDYVTVTNGSSSGTTPTPTPSYEQKNGKVKEDYVNVRSGPGTSYDKKECLRISTALTIVGEEKDSSGATWYKIKYSGGEGYMRSDFVLISSDNSSSDNNGNSGTDNSGSGNNAGSSVTVPTEGVAGKEGIVNQPQVNVRESASSSSSVLVILEKDVSVLIDSASVDSTGTVWYKISFAGTSGYMMGQYLTIH